MKMKTFKKILLIFGVIAILSMLLNGFGAFDKLKDKEESKEETPAIDETPVETVTFTLYYDENNNTSLTLLNETFTVEKGTTWLDFINSGQCSGSVFPNGELDSNPTFCYCALGSVYHFSDLENEVKLNDEIKDGTYGDKLDITITGNTDSTYSVIKGMTWEEFISYDTTEHFVYLGQVNENSFKVYYQDRCLDLDPDSRILNSSY